MNDYFVGSISGIAQTITGHPFDTLKVKRQNNIPLKYNFKRLYRGITFPLISNSIIIGTQFQLYHNNSILIAGLVSGIMTTPIDYFKIQKQMIKNYNYKLTWPLGFNITILREIISLPIYFESYYYFKEKTNNSFISGGLSGMLTWLLPYPIDTIKTRMQMGYTLKESIQQKNYMKGLGLCLARGFIVNAVGFYCVNVLSK